MNALKTGIGRAVAAPVSQEHFERLLSSIWRNGGKHDRLGLAISGGVDSMALATLCSRMKASTNDRPAFTSFIVDHGVRQGSAEEAAHVANILHKMDLEARVLKLDWRGTTEPALLPNIETTLRNMRYQILGEACRALNIDSLMVAHHADDQAETVLMRLIAGYHGFGLQGIREQMVIPECEGMYGVRESGTPKKTNVRSWTTRTKQVLVESGGINLYRPLLGYSKRELIATCRENGIDWVEDRTNKDVTLTVRNAVRSLLQSSRLPTALGAEAFVSYSRSFSERQEHREKVVEVMFDRCGILLDLCSGSVFVDFPEDLRQSLLGMADHERGLDEAQVIAAMLMRRVILLSSSQTVISVRGLNTAVQFVFPFLSPDRNEARMPKSVSTCNVILEHVGVPETVEKSKQETKNSRIQLQINRAPPTFHQVQSSVITLVAPVDKHVPTSDLVWSEWKLFDGRWWIRIQYRPCNLEAGHAIRMRFLSKLDIQNLHKQMFRRTMDQFGSVLSKHTPGEFRLALPTITERYTSEDEAGNERIVDNVLALPSVLWSKRGWAAWKEDDEQKEEWRWEIRYKKVEMGTGPRHEFMM